MAGKRSRDKPQQRRERDIIDVFGTVTVTGIEQPKKDIGFAERFGQLGRSERDAN